MLSKSQLGLSYVEYMSLLGIAFLGKVVSLRLWGRLAQRWGARRLLWIGGVGIIPVGGLWIVTGDFWYLAVVQAISGIAWAAYELALLLMFFEAIPRRERTSVLTIYNLGNAVALVIGALIGAAVLRLLGEATIAFMTLFGLSSLGRLTTLLLLARVPDLRTMTVSPAMRTIAIRPNADAVDPPILPSIPNGEHEATTAHDETASASDTVSPSPVSELPTQELPSLGVSPAATSEAA
jgi:MFS family permease